MRKFGACLAGVAAAAAVIVPTAFATAHSRAGGDQVKHFKAVRIIERHRGGTIRFVRHAVADATAQAAACQPGNINPPYCSPPQLNSLFGAFTNQGTVTESVYTNAPNVLLVAFLSSDGPKSGGQSMTLSCTSASGGACPVTFHKLTAENAGGGGDVEAWYADATSIISRSAPIKVTTSAVKSGCPSGTSKCDVNLSVITFQNAISPGSTGVQAIGIGNSAANSSSRGAPNVTVKTSEPDSWVWAMGNDWGGGTFRTVPSGQQAPVQIVDGGLKKTFWVQSTSSYTPNNGTSVTINDTAPASDPFNYVAVEIL
jgi:hypothetical protein